MAERVFGPVIVRKSDGKPVPTRLIGEQHVLEDLGRVPTLKQCLESLPLEQWMMRAARRLSTDLAAEEMVVIGEK